MKAVAFAFQRFEKKYLLTLAQYEAMRAGIAEKMQPDVHPVYRICNLYYDTPHFDLIRASLEHPIYKEKLRMRSYGTVSEDGKVFVELKKKFDGKVYKQRGIFPVADAEAFLQTGSLPGQPDQVRREIGWFLHRYQNIAPKVFIGYDREAYSGIDDPELRLTFDTRLQWRTDRLDLRSPDGGAPLLDDGSVLMEIKAQAAIPFWLARLVNEVGARPTSFSKYGTFYQMRCKEVSHV